MNPHYKQTFIDALPEEEPEIFHLDYLLKTQMDKTIRVKRNKKYKTIHTFSETCGLGMLWCQHQTSRLRKKSTNSNDDASNLMLQVCGWTGTTR